MRIYSVHIRRDGLDPDADIVLVKEGFSWPAALFMPLWALWRGLWFVAVGMILIIAAIMAVSAFNGFGETASSWLFLGASVISGYIANDLVRGSLERRDFGLCDIVAASNSDSAAFRFFDRQPELTARVIGSQREGLA